MDTSKASCFYILKAQMGLILVYIVQQCSFKAKYKLDYADWSMYRLTGHCAIQAVFDLSLFHFVTDK